MMTDPENKVKFKFNKVPWQETGERKGDEADCGFYCYLFVHNYVTLGEPFAMATEY